MQHYWQIWQQSLTHTPHTRQWGRGGRGNTPCWPQMKWVDMHRQLAWWQQKSYWAQVPSYSEKLVVCKLCQMTSARLGKTLLAAPKCTFHIITKWAPARQSWNLNSQAAMPTRQAGWQTRTWPKAASQAASGVGQRNEWHFIDGRQSGQFNCQRSRVSRRRNRRRRPRLRPRIWPGFALALATAGGIIIKSPSLINISTESLASLTRFTAFCLGISFFIPLPKGIFAFRP